MNNNKNQINVLCLGDVVSRPGREALRDELQVHKDKYEPDLVIVNGENASGGTGLEAKESDAILSLGADVITLGDHTWRYNSIHKYLTDTKYPLVRPANYPKENLGKGFFIREVAGFKVGVMNLMGRVFIDISLDCPFSKAEELLAHELKECDIIICDFHAEATAEKIAFAKKFDGRIHLVFGTHTHVATADQQILPKGTGYVTDLGMCGSSNGVIGLDQTVAIERIMTGVPSGYKAAPGPGRLDGIFASIDALAGKTTAIQRLEHS